MNQAPTELLAPYKAALVTAARDLLRAADSDGIAIEIPASVPPSVVVLGAEARIGQLLRIPGRKSMQAGGGLGAMLPPNVRKFPVHKRRRGVKARPPPETAADFRCPRPPCSFANVFVHLLAINHYARTAQV